MDLRGIKLDAGGVCSRRWGLGGPEIEPCVSYRAEGGTDSGDVRKAAESVCDCDSGIRVVGRRSGAVNSEYTHYFSCLKQALLPGDPWRTLKQLEYQNNGRKVRPLT